MRLLEKTQRVGYMCIGRTFVNMLSAFADIYRQKAFFGRTGCGGKNAKEIEENMRRKRKLGGGGERRTGRL